MNRISFLLLILMLTACQPKNTDESTITTDNPVYAALQQAMNGSQDSFQKNHPKGRQSHKAIIHHLYPGGRAEVQLELDAGEHYFIFAACDQHCHDIDLSLSKSDDTETLLAENTKLDNTPVLQYTPTQDGTYSIHIQMEHCESDECYYSLQAFTAPEE